MNNQYTLAVDVEATCDTDGKINRKDMEIIEIGAVLLDSDYNVIGEFQSFIKPFKNPILTDFCKQLTHITQEDVDNAPSVYEVFNQLGAWLKDYQPMVWCSWGDYDYKQFQVDCARSGASWPFIGSHFNAKKKCAEVTNNPKRGLHEAVEELGLKWIGTHHRGIDDARNIAQIFNLIMKD